MKTANYLIAYDIKDDKRLSRVRRYAYAHALGGQKSALEAPLSKSELPSIIASLNQLILHEDKVNLIKVAPNPILLGRATQLSFENGAIII